MHWLDGVLHVLLLEPVNRSHTHDELNQPEAGPALDPAIKTGSRPTPNAFTLVELLVVVAIVGILSAIALPNFLAQTDKAKATEAKTHIATTLKQAHAKYLEDGAAPESQTPT